MTTPARRRLQVLRTELDQRGLPMTFCPAPWMTMSIEADGGVEPCCFYAEPLRDASGNTLDLNSLSLSDAWKSQSMDSVRIRQVQGVHDDGCARCHQVEKDGGDSKRIGFAERFMHGVGSVREGRPVLRMLSLALSNRCNLQCRSCGPQSSVALVPEFIALRERVRNWDLSSDRDRFGPLPAQMAEMFALAEPRLEALLRSSHHGGATRPSSGLDVWRGVEEHLEDLEWIDFLGGEPMLIPAHESLLERIVAAGHANHIVLRYNTNGTVIPSRVVELWRQFRRIMVSVSLDAIGLRFEYLRFPAHWPRVADNVARYVSLATALPALEVQVNATVSIITFPFLHELLSWAEQQGLVLDLYPVSGWKMLDPQVMPQWLKNRVRDRLGATRPSHEQVEHQLRALLRHMDAADRSDLLPAFRLLTRLQDEYRGQRFEDAFPEVERLME